MRHPRLESNLELQGRREKLEACRQSADTLAIDLEEDLPAARCRYRSGLEPAGTRFVNVRAVVERAPFPDKVPNAEPGPNCDVETPIVNFSGRGDDHATTEVSSVAYRASG